MRREKGRKWGRGKGTKREIERSEREKESD